MPSALPGYAGGSAERFGEAGAEEEGWRRGGTGGALLLSVGAPTARLMRFSTMSIVLELTLTAWPLIAYARERVDCVRGCESSRSARGGGGGGVPSFGVGAGVEWLM